MLKSQRAAGFHGDEQVPTPDEWGTVLGDEVLATAILDRFLHHCEVIAINGPSYRLKDRADLVSTAEEPAP
jgi:hypothetical protein